MPHFMILTTAHGKRVLIEMTGIRIEETGSGCNVIHDTRDNMFVQEPFDKIMEMIHDAQDGIRA